MAGRALAFLLVLGVSTATYAGPRDEGDHGGWRYGGTVLVGTPRGELDDHVGTGGGLAGHALWIARGGAFGLRVDGTWLLYGSETLREPVSGTSGRVLFDTVRTDNWIAGLTAGPQIMVPAGPVRPYATAFAGVSYFSTTSELLGPDRFTALYTSTNHDDTTFSWGGGGGVLVPVGGGALLDLGVRYVANGRVSYLAKGDIAGDGTFVPRRSEGHTLELRLGVTVR